MDLSTRNCAQFISLKGGVTMINNENDTKASRSHFKELEKRSALMKKLYRNVIEKREDYFKKFVNTKEWDEQRIS